MAEKNTSDKIIKDVEEIESEEEKIKQECKKEDKSDEEVNDKEVNDKENKNKEKQSRKIKPSKSKLNLKFLILGIILIIAGAVYFIIIGSLVRDDKVITATVKDVGSNSTSDYNIDDTQIRTVKNATDMDAISSKGDADKKDKDLKKNNITFGFNANEHDWVVTDEASDFLFIKPDYKVGDKIKVYYNPEYPAAAFILKEQRKDQSYGALFVILGIICCVLAFVSKPEIINEDNDKDADDKVDKDIDKDADVNSKEK